MGEKISVISEEKTSVKGYFNLKDTYKNLMDFIENSLEYSVAVKDYDEKNQGGKREITAAVEAHRLYNEVYKILLKFKIEMEGKDETIEIDNKKLNVVQGSATITINCFLDPKWDAVRSPGPFAKFLQQVYNKYIGNNEEEDIKHEAKKDVKVIISRFKQHLNSSIK
jgi:hypothetical protein